MCPSFSLNFRIFLPTTSYEEDMEYMEFDRPCRWKLIENGNNSKCHFRITSDPQHLLRYKRIRSNLFELNPYEALVLFKRQQRQ